MLTFSPKRLVKQGQFTVDQTCFCLFPWKAVSVVTEYKCSCVCFRGRINILWIEKINFKKD